MNREQPEASGKVAARAVWGATPAGSTHAPDLAPGTREFLEAVLARRSAHELPWLQATIPFQRFAGKRVLEVGCGAGYDAVDIARHGAEYTGVDLTPENIVRSRTHLELAGLSGHVVEADAEQLPFDDASFDVVYSFGVLHHVPDITAAIAEVYRVLRPGGDAYIAVYNRNSIFYLLRLGFTEHLLKLGFRHASLQTRLRRIEATSSGALPIVNVYSRDEVRSMLSFAGFDPIATAIRKLNVEDLPNLPILERAWYHVPTGWLDTLGRRWGWYVVARARKPATAPCPRPQ